MYWTLVFQLLDERKKSILRRFNPKVLVTSEVMFLFFILMSRSRFTVILKAVWARRTHGSQVTFTSVTSTRRLHVQWMNDCLSTWPLAEIRSSSTSCWTPWSRRTTVSLRYRLHTVNIQVCFIATLFTPLFYINTFYSLSSFHPPPQPCCNPLWLTGLKAPTD